MGLVPMLIAFVEVEESSAAVVVCFVCFAFISVILAFYLF